MVSLGIFLQWSQDTGGGGEGRDGSVEAGVRQKEF